MNDSIPALEQYIEPAPVTFMPDAPGWYAIGILVIVSLLLTALLVWQYQQKNRYRRIAFEWLEREEKRLLAANDYHRLVYAANMLLKRILVSLNKKEEVAGLHGMPWLDYLNKTCPSAVFTAADTETIGALYDSNRPLDKPQTVAFTAKVKQWIKKHRMYV